MILTPSAKGSFLAGIGFWMLVWLTVFKVDDLAALIGLRRWITTDKCLAWVRKNKSATLLATEGCNFGIHGLSNPLGVTFALGGTLTNILMVFAVLPIRALFRR